MNKEGGKPAKPLGVPADLPWAQLPLPKCVRGLRRLPVDLGKQTGESAKKFVGLPCAVSLAAWLGI